MAQSTSRAYSASRDGVTCRRRGPAFLRSPDSFRSTNRGRRLSGPLGLLGLLSILVACDEGGVDCGTTPLAPACSEPPTISYSQGAYASPFFSTGNTPAPLVDWNGATGTLSLMGAVAGVTLDPSTGIVSWDASLPIGASLVQVVATNPAGMATASFNVDNRFEGHFEGAYNGDPESDSVTFDFEVTFHGDGSLAVRDFGASEGEGNWTRVGQTITAVYSYESGDPLTFQGDLTHNASEAVLEAFWYRGDEVADGEEQGFLSVSWVSQVP